MPKVPIKCQKCQKVPKYAESAKKCQKCQKVSNSVKISQKCQKLPKKVEKSREAKKEIRRLCQQLVNMAVSDTFVVFSTHRQFTRYKDNWTDGKLGYQKEWKVLADVALKELSAEHSI